jgi:hypothetical protein
VTGPRKWQKEVFEYIGEHFKNPKTRHTVCRIAVCSGNGPGKSSFAGMLSWWGASTFEDCRINVTANTKNQLDTKTSPEFAKWFRNAINKDWFDVHVTSIKITDQEHAKNWRIDFLPWSDANPAAVAGQHNKGKRIILIFDEASEIARIIFETAEGALTDENTEIIFMAAWQSHGEHGRVLRRSFREHEAPLESLGAGFAGSRRNQQDTDRAMARGLRRGFGLVPGTRPRLTSARGLGAIHRHGPHPERAAAQGRSAGR